MKVLHINWQIWGPHFKGGHAIHAETLIKGLSAIPDLEQAYLFTSERKDDSGENMVVSTHDGLLFYEIKNNPINYLYDLPANDLGNPLLEKLVRDVIEDFRPDVVHVHHLIQFPLSILDIIRYHFDIPVVVTIRDYWYVCKAWNLTNQLQELCCVDNNCYLCAECMSTKSGQSREVIAKATSHGEFLTRKYRYLHELEACEGITFVSQYLLNDYQRLGLSGDNAVVCTVGGPFEEPPARGEFNRVRNIAFLGYVSAYKGVHFVLESLKGWKGTPFNLHLWGGVEDPAYLDQIRDEIPGVTIFVNGTYERSDLPHILADVDVGLVPSIWPDTAPQVLLDFFSFKIPVLASRIGGIPELVQDGQTGLLFEPSDTNSFLGCLERLVNDDALLAQLSRKIVHPKTFHAYAEEIHAFYHRVVDFKNKLQSASVPMFDLARLGDYRKLIGLRERLEKFFCHTRVSGVSDLSLYYTDTEENKNEYLKKALRGRALLFAHNAFRGVGYKDIVELPFRSRSAKSEITLRGRKGVDIAVYPLGDTEIASTRARIFNVLPRLELYGYRVDFKSEAERLDDYDLVIVQKRCDDFLFDLRKPFILDIDDNYFEHGPDSEKFIALAALASAVVVSSEYLYGIAVRFNRNVHLIPTGLDVHEIRCQPERVRTSRDRRRLVWVGYPENLRYIEKLLPILKAHSLILRVITRNDPEVTRFIEKNRDVLEFRPWELSTVDQLVADCDIGIAPLEKDSWSQAKSGYKVLKYLSLGLRVVCDASAEYEKLERDLGERIVAHTLQEWETMLLTDKPMGRGVDIVLDGYSSGRLVSSWERVIRTVTDDRDLRLAEKDQQMAVKDQLVMQKNQQLIENDQLITQKDRQLAEKDRQLAERDLRIQELMNSMSWRITRPLRSLLDAINWRKSS